MISGRWPCENAFPKGMRRADYGGRMAYRRARCVQHLSNGLCADKASRAAFRRACARQASDYSFAAAWMHKAGITQSCGGLRADDYPRAFAATIEKVGAKSKRGRSIRRGTVCHIGYANKGEAQTSEFPTKDTAKPPTADRGSPKHPLGGLAEYDPCPASPALRGARHLPLAGAAATKKEAPPLRSFYVLVTRRRVELLSSP